MSSLPIVVCVDDEPAVLEILKRCLQRLDVELRLTTEPEQVLQWITEETVAVVVSDYEMPQMNGGQLTGRAKNLRPETVRILLTGQRNLETAVDGINQGEVFRFVSKPFEPEGLRSVIRDALARHEELMALSSDRSRYARRLALRNALEKEHPGISTVDFEPNGAYRVPTNILDLVAKLDIDR